MKVVVTGGQGDLAKSIRCAFEQNGDEVYSPGREECNVIDEASISRYLERVGDHDLLICNAGIGQEQLFARTKQNEAATIMQTNLHGAFHSAQFAAKKMIKKRQGHIIFISSHLALQARPGQAIYASSKAALHGLTKSLARELGPRNIRINTVLPGFLDTKMVSSLSSELKEEICSEHSLKRFNTTEAVADFLLFLHHKMPHTSGQIFNLDSRPLPLS